MAMTIADTAWPGVRGGRRPVERTAHRLAPSLDLVRSRLRDEVTVSDMASAVHFSMYHFHRLFGRTFGESAGDYIQRARLERAATLMRTEPHRELARIATDTGFAFQSSLTRAFKNRFGVSPTRWRALHRSSPSRQRDLSVSFHGPLCTDTCGMLLPGQPSEESVSEALSLIWARTRSSTVGRREAFVLTWDDPLLTPVSRQRYEVLVAIGDTESVPGSLLRKRLCFERVAQGPVRDRLAEVRRDQRTLMSDWAEASRYRLTAAPRLLWIPEWEGPSRSNGLSHRMRGCAAVEP